MMNKISIAFKITIILSLKCYHFIFLNCKLVKWLYVFITKVLSCILNYNINQ